jgi:hypothetical protein
MDSREDLPIKALPRLPYQRPVVEPLGCWRALTLQQSVPITGFNITRPLDFHA